MQRIGYEIIRVLLFVLTLVPATSCRNEEAVNSGNDLFTLLPADSTGVGFVNRLSESEDFNIIQYLYFNNGAGVTAGDINNDGLVDLYFSSNQTPCKLYLNKGNLKFEDITEKAGVGGKGDWKTGVTMADVNGDGFLDIYLCEVGNYKVINGKNQLFINQGDLTFREEAEKYGLDFCGFSTQAAFFDYDLDGDLDMYLLNHSVHTSRSYGAASLRYDHDSLAGDRLYMNDVVNGNCHFREVTTGAGIYNSQIGYGLGVNISDFNNDGWPDIYISNDFHEDDYMYINNCNGTFTDRFKEYIRHTSRSSMGNDAGDINNDGLTDIIVLDMLPEDEKTRKQSGGEDEDDVYRIKLEYGYGYQFVRNTLQLNLGGGMFSEIGRLSGVYSTDWSWSPLLCDVDNDGYKDIFITNGIYRRSNNLDYVKFLTENDFFENENNKNTPDKVLYEKMPLDQCVNYIYKNNGDLSFTNMAMEWGLKTRSYSNGSAYADLDNDGDLDLVCNNINEPAYIYRNNSKVNHFLNITLKGKGLNTHAIGARITVYCKDKMQIADFFPTRGFMSASSGDMHFGLGASETIDSLIVRWPDHTNRKLRNVPADSHIEIDMTVGENSNSAGTNNDLKPVFSKSIVPGLEYRHIEDEFDFKHEVLVPHNLFAEGPGLAVADFNGDRLQDVFAGSAKGQPSALYIQNSGGTFSQTLLPVFVKDLYSETVDAAAFDADGDKDIDLYLVRGGSGNSQGDTLLTDRMLMNDGKAAFTESKKGSLPSTAYNGSCVEPCDFDNDGDIDLFVGSRSVPGAYGLSPKQLLLENDGKGNFSDVADKRMKRNKKPGMVTDACWIDYDNDGDKDLVIAGEWMKITVLNNNKGYFSDKTEAAGLEETSGWWNCLYPADIDNDGDTDIIGGNLGLNSTLKASVKEPVEMYLNDFDGNGILDQVICSYREGVSYPVASFDQLRAQINGIEKKFPHYSDFAGKTAKDIFGITPLKRGIKKDAVLFESCLFINDGNGKFRTIKLPAEAQFSPVRSILSEDINRDGFADILLVGNDYTAKPSFGRYDASYGWCLLNDKSGNYKSIMPVKSGFIVNGDARKLLPLVISGTQYVIAGVNDNDLQIFKEIR